MDDATIRFDGIDDQLFIDSFANDHISPVQPFTIFMVSSIRIGGLRNLWQQRDRRRWRSATLSDPPRDFRYNDLDKGLEPTVHGSDAAISVFTHDGAETIAAWVNGESKGQTTGLDGCPKIRRRSLGHAVPQRQSRPSR